MGKKAKPDIYISLLFILLSNAVIVYGVLSLNWNFFMVLYSYWFGELISSVFDTIKYRTLKKRNELLEADENKETTGRFFFLFVYWVFIVILVGFITAPDKTWGDNIFVILFLNKTFNFNLFLLLFGELGLFFKNFILSKNYNAKNIISENSLLNKKTMIMHVSIIIGAFIWFAMNTDKFFFHINAGKYGTYGFMMTFVAIKLTGDLIVVKKNFD